MYTSRVIHNNSTTVSVTTDLLGVKWLGQVVKFDYVIHSETHIHLCDNYLLHKSNNNNNNVTSLI